MKLRIVPPCSLVDMVSHTNSTFYSYTLENFQSHLVKVKLSLYKPWRPLELREGEAPTFSDIRLINGGKVVSPTLWPRFTPRKIPGTHFC
jgi:hypothetical protein